MWIFKTYCSNSIKARPLFILVLEQGTITNEIWSIEKARMNRKMHFKRDKQLVFFGKRVGVLKYIIIINMEYHASLKLCFLAIGR